MPSELWEAHRKANISNELERLGKRSMTKVGNGTGVGLDIDDVQKYANRAKEKIKREKRELKRSADEIVSTGRKKYKEYMNAPVEKPSATTRKKINESAKNLSKENRVSEAKKYRQTKRILKESGYVPNGNARDRYKMDRENQSRINTNRPGVKINMYSSSDDWDERLKKKKKKR